MHLLAIGRRRDAPAHFLPMFLGRIVSAMHFSVSVSVMTRLITASTF
jgi:hypothetical protein